MTSTAVVVTTAGTMTTASLADVIQWGLSGFPHPVPQSVALAIAAGLISLGHLLYHVIAVRYAGAVPADPPATTQETTHDQTAP